MINITRHIDRVKYEIEKLKSEYTIDKIKTKNEFYFKHSRYLKVNNLPIIDKEEFEIEGPALTFNSRLFQPFQNNSKNKLKTELKYKFGFSPTVDEMGIILKYDMNCMKNWSIEDRKIIFTYTENGEPNDEAVVNRIHQKAKRDLKDFFEHFDLYVDMLKKFNEDVDKYVDLFFDEILVELIKEKNKKERNKVMLNPFI